MKILKHILAVILGLLAAAVVYCLLYWIIAFLGSLPIIGALIYFPSDAAWTLIVIPSSTASLIAAYTAYAIAGDARPMSVCLAAFWVINIIFMFSIDAFSWRELLTSLVGAGSAGFCAINGKDMV